ncbi:IS4 family transposase [Rivularia sp. UHCC 0363]|uniref:IS4 family transposase n=1 Tax=Rivularia sp. UHCC 0363 TaxID=3110244 RepID=UPI002B218D9F|nr:IS4 family transposase [Rivularia sp. UHCC 0363]MEA5595917.1 IS4 family transposase [Rivularia sp. UHCC 0363]
MLSPLFDAFVEASPVSVMMRVLMERIFNSERMNHLFKTYSDRQYEQELLFSTTVDLMSVVVCGMYPSVHAAYQKKAVEISVSATALYNKLQRVELPVSRALLRETASDLQELLAHLNVESPSCLGKQYPIRIVDGSCLALSERRLKALRGNGARPLPGKTIAILDPQTKLVVDVIPCEDGHAQERSLFGQVLAQVLPQQVWIADRNFCTSGFLHSIIQQSAFFVIRQHGNLGYTPTGELQEIGLCETGIVFEQLVEIAYEGGSFQCRRIVVKLTRPTRDQECEMTILTNLPPTDASSILVAELYRGRWSVETLFQTVTQNFHGEIETLAYPKAALFSYCMALSAYNLLATLKAVLGSVHGVNKIQAGLSDFYLVDDIHGIYRGMMIAIPPLHWQCFENCTLSHLVDTLEYLATKIHLKSFRKHPRNPKKKQPPPMVDRKHPHCSTKRKLKQYKANQDFIP